MTTRLKRCWALPLGAVPLAALLASAAVATPAAHADQGCTLSADVAFSHLISMQTSTGDIAVSDARTTCGGAPRTLTGSGYFGEAQPPILGALGPDTCLSGVEYLYLYAPGRRTRQAKLAPLSIELTLHRSGTKLTAGGGGTLGAATLTLSGSGVFAPSTPASCLASGWAGGQVTVSLSAG